MVDEAAIKAAQEKYGVLLRKQLERVERLKNEPDWTEFTVDGVHATDLGFYMFAKMLTPRVARILAK